MVKLGGQQVVAQETGAIPVSTSITALGTDLMRDAAAAKAGDVLPQAYPVPSGIAIATVKERNHPDESKFAQEREGVLRSLQSTKANAVKQAWIKGLRDEAKVIENPELLATERPGAPSPD